MNRTSRVTTLLAAAGIAVILAGCGAQGGNSPAPSSPGAAASQAAGGSPAAYVVEVKRGGPGSFLSGEAGKTLYVLTKDSSGSSTCSGSCATAWPPFTLDAGETVSAGAGVSGTIATIKRPDGSDQVAINGQPLYYYSGDSAAGDTNGQGTNGVWFVAGPDGAPVGASAPAASAAYGY